MRKNKMMRIASGLLVAVLLTTCAISGTFAKYVTENSGISSARVAKWGVEITASGNAFSTQYETHDTTANTTIVGGHSVRTSNADNLVAPGTNGSLTNVKITGAPEVAVRITNEAEVSIGDKWVGADGQYYCPLVITVNGAEFYGMGYDDAASFAAAVKTAIDDTTKEYPANTNLETEANASGLSVSWAWAFDANSSVTHTHNTDRDDTYLGNQAAAGNAAEVYISIKTTATQID